MKITQRKNLAILLIASGLSAQTVSLHVTATPQPKADTKAAFGNLGNHLAVSVDICLAEPAALKVATARVRQAVKMPAGYTLLSSQVAAEVIQAAQGNSPIATWSRLLGGAASAAGAAVAIKAVPTSGWGSGVILGGEGASILLQYIFPALATHAVLNATTLLPEMLDFDPTSGACVSGPVIVAGPKKAAMGELDQTVSVETGAAK